MQEVFFSDVSKRYPNGCEALNQVSFQLAAGDLAFITGHSSAGKTTLLHLILRLQRPTQGQIVVDGKNLTRLTREQIRALRSTIGFIPQEPWLFATQTVWENVALPLVLQGRRESTFRQQVHTLLERLGLAQHTKHYPGQLSAAEQRRVSLARAIIHAPALLLADEPTAQLDPYQAATVIQVLQDAQRAGTTVLIATQDLMLVAPLPYRILTLKQGKMVNGN